MVNDGGKGTILRRVADTFWELFALAMALPMLVLFCVISYGQNEVEEEE